MKKQKLYCQVCGSSIGVQVKDEFQICADCLHENKQIILKGMTGVYIRHKEVDGGYVKDEVLSWKTYTKAVGMHAIDEKFFIVKETDRLQYASNYVRKLEYAVNFYGYLRYLEENDKEPPQDWEVPLVWRQQIIKQKGLLR